MNQLEYFVAMSESARSDAWRYLCRLRQLDERMAHYMRRLHEIAATFQTSGEIQKSPRRARYKRGRSVSRNESHTESAVDDGVSSMASSVVFVESEKARLLSEYRLCQHRVMRHAGEREKLAEELMACGAEMEELFAIRMAQLKQTRNDGNGV